MTELSRKIIERHLVRKSKKQKKAFRAALIADLAEMGIEAREEKYKDLAGSVNVIAGDVDRAELVFSAHYDTCARMFLPNFITPLNKPVYFAYQLMVVALMLGLSVLPALPVGKIFGGEAAYMTWYLTYITLFVLMLAGPANPTTMNDNTSGVVALIELMNRMPESLRSRCAFIFFDNEEMHMLGSGAFRKKHESRMKEIPLVNMDCIGDGEYLLLAASKAFREDERLYAALKNAFDEKDGALHTEAERTMYPSDQKGFEKSLAAAAMKKGRVGYYIDRIHTTRDTVLKEENVERIIEGLHIMTETYLS